MKRRSFLGLLGGAISVASAKATPADEVTNRTQSFDWDSSEWTQPADYIKYVVYDKTTGEFLFLDKADLT